MTYNLVPQVAPSLFVPLMMIQWWLQISWRGPKRVWRWHHNMKFTIIWEFCKTWSYGTEFVNMKKKSVEMPFIQVLSKKQKQHLKKTIVGKPYKTRSMVILLPLLNDSFILECPRLW